MKSRILFGALALTATIVVAACGSSNTPTTAPTATSQTTAASTSTTPSTALPNMPMDTMLGTESATSTTDPTPMASAPMAANPGSTPMASIPMADNPGSSPMGTDPMGSMDMGGSDSGTQGLALQVANPALAANQPATLAFKVVAADGSALTHFQVEQTKLLHLILVRSDLTGFQHVHPTMAADGTWTVPVTFANGGTYRVVADFVPVLGGTATARVALTSDLTVAGTGSDKALPAPATTATIDGYTVQRAGALSSTTESPLTFTVVDSAGKPVMLEPYLGAFGHLVAFAASDLAYTHIHPSSADQKNGSLTFIGQVTAPGLHRLFMQFSLAGMVHVAEFTIDAK